MEEKLKDWPEVRGHSASETAHVNGIKAPRNVVLADANFKVIDHTCFSAQGRGKRKTRLVLVVAEEL